MKEDFIENCNKNSEEGYFLDFDDQYSEELHGLHNDLPFLPKIIKIKTLGKLAANLHD